MAVSWGKIVYVWGLLFVILAALKLLWRVVRPLLTRNEKILGVRISYNRFLTLVGGIVGTIMILTTIFLRNIPLGAEIVWWSADLSKQNLTFNIITAICTGLATIYGGYQHNKVVVAEAKIKNIPEEVVAKVTKAKMRESVKNGILLGIFALWVTRLMPSSHDLSVLAFEACYVLSPLTFDQLIPKKSKPLRPESFRDTSP